MQITRHLRHAAAVLLLAHLPAQAVELADAAALLESNDPRAAAAVIALAQAEPDNPDVQVLKAHLLLLQGDAEAAIDVAKRAVERAPRSAQAHLWLGNGSTAFRVETRPHLAGTGWRR